MQPDSTRSRSRDFKVFINQSRSANKTLPELNSPFSSLSVSLPQAIDLRTIFPPEEGFVTKHSTRNSYGLLLPVAVSSTVRNQVWNGATNQCWKEQSKHPIELMFRDVPGLESFFKIDPNHTAGWVKFSGDKVEFSEQIVPTLAPEYFEPFRPMFDFISATIAA